MDPTYGRISSFCAQTVRGGRISGRTRGNQSLPAGLFTSLCDGALSPPGPCGFCTQFPSEAFHLKIQCSIVLHHYKRSFSLKKKKSTYFDFSSFSFDLPGCRSARGACRLSRLQPHSLEQELWADLHLHRTLFQVTDSALQGEKWLAADGAFRDPRHGKSQCLFSLIQAPGGRQQRWDHPCLVM